MNILIAPNSMKGSLTATRFADAAEKAFVETNGIFFNVRKIPVADGGDGTAEVLISGLGLEKICKKVHGPLGKKVSATFGYGKKIAVIEMAEASGMKLLKPSELNPLKTNSFGTGELILEAINLGAEKIYLGVGGSATVDGGAGMMEALGIKFFDIYGKPLSGNGENLQKISEIDISPLRISKSVEIKILSDVNNPLLGKNGAPSVFAPQKGATPEMIKLLETGLKNLEFLISKKTGAITANINGSGAAGGIGIGLVAFLNAKFVKGAEFILNTLLLDQHLKWANLVITGEGKFDRQSLQDKAPAVVASHAKRAGKPVYAIVGKNEYPEQDIFDRIISLTENRQSVQESIAGAEKLVYSAAKKIAQIFLETSNEKQY